MIYGKQWSIHSFDIYRDVRDSIRTTGGMRHSQQEWLTVAHNTIYVDCENGITNAVPETTNFD